MDALQRRVMEEDVVQYKLFFIQPDGPPSQQTEEHLTHLVEEIMAKVAPLLIQYIWQHQSFNLKYHPEKEDVPAHIGGSTQFGDSVEDEWFIVYLLQQITEAFPQLAARVEDNDGEFLLIEAADYLPKWLNPDTSENRVFFYRGELHILPCPSKSSTVGLSKGVVPSVAQALALLSTHPEACQASPKICSVLRKRLEGYPEKIKTGLHRAHCFIPAGVAMVLAQRPDLVAPAVSAFYLRDPVDLQACRSFKTFPPDTRVLTSVTFTRCLYAQLQQQQFTPDRRSGFTLPPHSHPQYKAHELGMKLAHGFEILCSKCQLPSSEPDAPVSCNPQWKGFMDSLIRNGYFRGEMEGSARYRELKRSGENFFKQSVASKSSALSPGEEVLQLLHSCNPVNLEELKKQESQLPQEDSDSWLDITAQDLERMLQERSGERAVAGSPNSTSDKQTDHVGGAEERRKEMEEREGKEAGYSLVAVSQGMKNFLNAVSSHEGAELPWSSSTQPFSFDPDSMSNAVDRLLGNNEEELDSDDLDDDDDEEEEEKEEGSSGHAEMNGTETLDGLRGYMDQMDEELMSTNIGQSFNVRNFNKTGLGNGSNHPSATDHLPAHGGVEETEEEIQPLDVDLNLVTNLLESLSCQAGLAGPASNLLQSLGIHLPPNSDPS
ncbi:protein ecdysoneless homolog isoform X1 [Dicentrarchus labrax]|uniref:Ecdysoneless homolog (Drosophila) n=1 Tax=Dicentrarchus labrax TaxID=13489 RepID=A0A8C4HQ96_DICLA|nr:protein ecdysoneless homolog isoform X1 [Dicentrarchus labrax]XP_051280793.1 protein ecdysoneless homolog isoform X1 [Dicentrarchus labrax]XP_051280803.1 protein ecdysoneless homolog isoform X1 [Dicentrarchus labrax]XP_051280812.1 protein ecdysoneless homolog isoform X1 [Dicentrarchus labrax]XP_051280822.1 protein ecdysoneless homolog isoform X1 [Dicentrarchus labrax]XP_051280830.1 protein ecdysoneless homolog isoform X1 [Dicentrarchus labrax]XP_051280839.1 protein ecdysoneless homolog iso